MFWPLNLGEHRIKDYQFKAAENLLYREPDISTAKDNYDPQGSGFRPRESDIHGILADAFEYEETSNLPRLIRITGMHSDPHVYGKTVEIDKEVFVGSGAVRRIHKAVDPVIRSTALEPGTDYSVQKDGKIQISEGVWGSFAVANPEIMKQIYDDIKKLGESQKSYDRLRSELATDVRHAIYDTLRSYIEWTQEGSRINSRLAGRCPSLGKILEAGASIRKAWRGRYVTWERLAKIAGMLESSEDDVFVHTSGSGMGIMVKLRPEYMAQPQLELLMEKTAKEETAAAATGDIGVPIPVEQSQAPVVKVGTGAIEPDSQEQRQ